MLTFLALNGYSYILTTKMNNITSIHQVMTVSNLMILLPSLFCQNLMHILCW